MLVGIKPLGAKMDAIGLLLFILPSYVANSSPVILGGGRPVDLGCKLWDGRRLFGDGKTLRGLAAGIAAGTVAGYLLAFAGLGTTTTLDFNSRFAVGLLLSVGTMAGDLLGSFTKRRMSIERGAQHEFFDQLLFLGVALLFAAPFYLPAPEEIVFLFAVTYVLHKMTNLIAHKLKLKSVPW